MLEILFSQVAVCVQSCRGCQPLLVEGMHGLVLLLPPLLVIPGTTGKPLQVKETDMPDLVDVGYEDSWWCATSKDNDSNLWIDFQWACSGYWRWYA